MLKTDLCRVFLFAVTVFCLISTTSGIGEDNYNFKDGTFLCTEKSWMIRRLNGQISTVPEKSEDSKSNCAACKTSVSYQLRGNPAAIMINTMCLTLADDNCVGDANQCQVHMGMFAVHYDGLEPMSPHSCCCTGHFCSGAVLDNLKEKATRHFSGFLAKRESQSSGYGQNGKRRQNENYGQNNNDGRNGNRDNYAYKKSNTVEASTVLIVIFMIIASP